MNYIYEIGYGDYDGSQEKQFFHKEKFTEKELLEIITECMLVGIDESFLNEHENLCQLSISDILYGYSKKSRFEEELRKRGFHEVQKEITINFNDETIIGESNKQYPEFQKDFMRGINENIDVSVGVCAYPYNFHMSNKNNNCLTCPYIKDKKTLMEAVKEDFKYIKNKFEEKNPGDFQYDYYEKNYNFLKNWIDENDN